MSIPSVNWTHFCFFTLTSVILPLAFSSIYWRLPYNLSRACLGSVGCVKSHSLMQVVVAAVAQIGLTLHHLEEQ